MNPFELVNATEGDERFANLTLGEKVQVRRQLLDNIKFTDEYMQFTPEQQQEFDKKFLTREMAGLDPASLVTGDEEDTMAAKFLEQAATAREGVSSVTFGDGFVETGKDYLTGKLAAFVTDIFTDEDTTKRLYGDRSDAYRDYRDFVLETMDADGMTDYKIGRTLGHIAGFAGDAAAATALYGSVGAPGLLTKGFGGFGSKLAGQTFKNFGQKALAYTPAVIGQMGFETAAFIGETAIADMITGQLDSDTEFQEYLKTIPSTAGQGMVYFLVGESLGAGLASSMKGLGNVFTKRGFQDQVGKQLMNDPKKMLPMMQGVLEGRNGAEAELVSLLKSGGAEDGQIKKIVEGMRDARIWADPETLAKEPMKLKQLAVKTFYGMDTDIVGDGLQIKSFGGETLNNPVTVTTGNELQEFLEANLKKFKNKEFELSAKYASDRSGSVKLEVETTQGAEALNLDAGSFNATFRPEGGTVNRESLQQITNQLMPDDGFTIKPIDDYFKTKSKVDINSKEILVPQKINNADEASKFAREYFYQVKRLKGGDLEFNTKQLEAMLRGTTDINYDKKFLNLIYRPSQLTFKPDGTVTIKTDGQEFNFKNVEEAGLNSHLSITNETDINMHLKKNLGLFMQTTDDGIVLRDQDSGKKIMSFGSIDEMFKSQVTRPPLPWASRGDFKAFSTGKVDGETSTLFKEGTLEQARESLKKFAKSPSFVAERYQTSLGKVMAEPKFQKFIVTLEDSGMRREFNTLKTAENWLKKDFGKFNELENELWEMGYRLTPVSGGYTIRTEGMKPKFAGTLDDVRAVVGDLEDMPNLKDTFDAVPEADLREVETLFKKEIQPYLSKLQSKQVATRAKSKGFGSSRLVRFFDKHWKPIRNRLEKIGDLKSLGLYTKLEAGDKAFKLSYSRLKQQSHAMFHGKGRDFSPTELRTMGKIMSMELDGTNWKKIAQDNNMDLTETMVETMEEVRSMFDTMGRLFDIDEKRWVEHYFPRLSRFDSKDFDAYTNIDVMKKAMGEVNTREIDAWFEHARIEDFVESHYEDNIEAILDTYMRIGLRKKYLADPIEDVHKAIDANELDDEAKGILQKSSDQVAGRMYSSERAEEVAERVRANKARADKILAGEGKYENLSIDERRNKALDVMNTDWKRFSSDLVTSSLMAYKMKMPIRNVAQVWNIGSTMVGGEYIVRGQKYLGDTNNARALYKELYNKGIIKPRETVELHGPQIDKIVKSINRHGLNNFYHSDDYTRMVMSTASRERFRDGLSLIGQGDVDLEGFMKFTKADWLNELDQEQFARLMAKKEYDAAETLLMRRHTQMTMFEYDLLNKPEGMTSGLGKIWGQYGTYPSQYLEFMKRGVQKEGPWFLTKLTVATASVAAMYNDLLNIGGINVTPWETAMFTGSPVFSSMISMGNAVGQGGYSSPKELLSDVSIGIPLYGIGRSAYKGFEEIAEGQYFDGIIRMLGATPSDDYLFESVADDLTRQTERVQNFFSN